MIFSAPEILRGTRFIVLASVFLMSACVKPADAPLETRCFTVPFLHCDQLADWDGE